MLPPAHWSVALLFLAFMLFGDVASRQPNTDGAVSEHVAAVAAAMPQYASTDPGGQPGGVLDPDETQPVSRQSDGGITRRKREETDVDAPTSESSYCAHDFGMRMLRYSFGLGKRAPYAFGLGRRSPYSFGLGKRAPYSFGLGKRAPYSFGLGKRRSYSFGLGKRSWGSWFDGPTTRDLLKRPSYSFGLGKRSIPVSHLWETEPDAAGGDPLPVPPIEGGVLAAPVDAAGRRKAHHFDQGQAEQADPRADT